MRLETKFFGGVLAQKYVSKIIWSALETSFLPHFYLSDKNLQYGSLNKITACPYFIHNEHAGTSNHLLDAVISI